MEKIGKYQILQKIGQGGSGCVFLCEDPAIGKKWAVKKIKRTDDRQLREVKILMGLDHPAIPRIVEQIEDDECVYAVMDYMEGITLQELLRRKHNVSMKMRLEWTIALCDVIGYLHSQTPPVIYRDLKPGNVIITKQGKVKLVDFGIARIRTLEAGDKMGTKGYAAPEQYAGDYGIASDIYGIGATMRAMSPNEKNYAWNRIIGKAMSPDPDRRYVNCAFMRKDLKRLEQSVQSQKRVRNMLLFVIGGVGIVLMAQFIVEQIWQQRYLEAMREERYESAITLYPEKGEAYLGMLHEYEEKGQLSKGIELAEAYVKEYSGVLDADEIWEQIGMYYLCGNKSDTSFGIDYAKAKECFEQIDTKRSDSAKDYKKLADILSLSSKNIAWGEVEQVLEQIEDREVKTKDVKSIHWRQNIAGIYMMYEKELLKEGVDAQQKAMHLLQENEDIIYDMDDMPQKQELIRLNTEALAELYRSLGNKGKAMQKEYYQKSLDCYNLLLNTQEGSKYETRYYLQAASLYRLLKDYGKARLCYENSLNNRTDLETYCAYAWMELNECKNKEKAKELYDVLKKLDGAQQNLNVLTLKARLEGTIL